MARWAVCLALVAAIGFSDAATAKAFNKSVHLPPARPVQLSEAQKSRLNGLIVQHRAGRSALPADQRDDLDRLTARVRVIVLREGIGGGMLESAKTAIHSAMPGLSDMDVLLLVTYTVDGLAAGDAIGAAAGGNSQQELFDATREMQETQMSFNLQYLQLQSQMQNENRSYTAVSNILKTKHDTVKNSIGNIR